MNTAKRLSKVFNSSKELSFNDKSKIIIMSDCHRGNGSNSDNFFKNKNLFLTALRYYYEQGYTYIEIGDGDELWENKSLKSIINVHKDVFKEMAKFYAEGRFHMIYGNHDIEKKEFYIKNDILREYCDHQNKETKPLFPDIDISEGIILRYEGTDDKIFLVHGHQGDFLNDDIWRIARFLVRHLWGPLEAIGVNNPINTATNNRRKSKIEKKLINWAKNNNQLLIAGHTHRSFFSKVGKHLYFNDGCCTNPFDITGIEISDGAISLVKWDIKAKPDHTLFIDREILAGPIKLQEYFDVIHNQQ